MPKLDIEKSVFDASRKLGLVRPVRIKKVKKGFKILHLHVNVGIETRKTHHFLYHVGLVTRHEIRHELCHARLNEIGVGRCKNLLLKQMNGKSSEDIQQLLQNLNDAFDIVEEFYAEYLNYKTFNETTNVEALKQLSPLQESEIKAILKENPWLLATLPISLAISKRFGLNVSEKLLENIGRVDPRFSVWMETIVKSLYALPDLPRTLNNTFLDAVLYAVEEIHNTIPTSLGRAHKLELARRTQQVDASK